MARFVVSLSAGDKFAQSTLSSEHCAVLWERNGTFDNQIWKG